METQLFDISRETLKQISTSAVLVLVYFIARFVISRFNTNYAIRNNIHRDRALQTSKIISFVLSLIFIILIAVVWEFDFEEILTYMLTVLTLIGIGLFAQWSILSNITASVILFFYFPYRIGGRVKIMDGEHSIVGTVRKISLFSVKIEDDEGQLISYPNNLAIQKPIVSLE